MTYQCIDCKQFSLREAGAMARLGFGHCVFEKSRASFYSATYKRHCQKYESAGREAAERRRQWLEGVQQKFVNEVMSHES
ncbi:hypothetical protein D7I39_10980 [Allopusillimonas ginsengisoli]|nr:hypothetical protein D7I39_10980 [Allopusillimonas ginsengisoli]